MLGGTTPINVTIATGPIEGHSATDGPLLGVTLRTSALCLAILLPLGLLRRRRIAVSLFANGSALPLLLASITGWRCRQAHPG